MTDTSTPDRIWLDWKEANDTYTAFAEPPENEFQDGQVEWVRADLFAALEAQIATLTAERDAARAGRVKPLEWQRLGHGFWRANAPLFGSIRVDKYGLPSAPFSVSWSVPGLTDVFAQGEFGTEDEAKAVAQAEYEARILAALEKPE